MSPRSPALVRIVLFLCAVCCAGACSSSGSDRDTGSVSSAISGGEPDSTDSNVFLLVSHRPGRLAALCSASLIAPNLLLTARHCVASTTSDQVTCGQTEAAAPFPANTFFAANALSAADITAAYAVSSVSVPTEGSDICGFDIALLTLTAVVPTGVATPLIPRIDRGVKSGERYSAVGYGQTSPGDADIAGERRDRTGLKVDCAPGSCGQGVEASEFVGDAGICSGDSGGPALDIDGKVVGVVSRSADDCNHPVYGSVASWKDWITGVTRQAATAGNYPAPFWVDSGSSDPPVPSGSSAGAAGDAASAGSTAVAAGVQGDRCTASTDCQSGYGCYSPTRSASDAYCAAFCSDQSQCESGTACDVSGSGVCVAPLTKENSDSSCALSATGPSGGAGAGAALAGLAFAVSRVRRRASRRAPGASISSRSSARRLLVRRAGGGPMSLGVRHGVPAGKNVSVILRPKR